MSYLSQVQNYQVKNRDDMVKFIDLVIDSTQEERGEALDMNTLIGAETLKDDAKTAVGNKTLAMIFAELRDGAKDSDAPKTSAAVVQAASWFYRNVENPQSSTTSTALPAYAQPATPFYKKDWFIPVVIGVVGLTVAGAILFWPDDEENWQIQD